MSLEKLKFVLLSDFYGKLLTEKQQSFLKLHYEKDLSLGEIAERFGVTRQAVHDSIRSSEIALERYEKELALLSEFQRQRDVCSDILENLQQLETELHSSEILRAIQNIKGRIHTLMNPSGPPEQE